MKARERPSSASAMVICLSATRGPANGFRPTRTVGYYAGGIGTAAKEAPSCPVQLRQERRACRLEVEAVRQAHPDV
jgi:carboxymethylenebutenolidase